MRRGKTMIEQNKIRKIYQSISDDISKEIFCARFLYSMTEDEMFLGKWLRISEKVLKLTKGGTH